MSCHEFEGLIALHVEGDLEETERQRVEQHLRACIACQSLTDELRESQAAFKSMRQDVAGQTALSSVRARVLADIANMESRSLFERLFWGGFRQRVTLAGTALLLVGGAALWFSVGGEVVRESVGDEIVVARVPVPEPKPQPVAEAVSTPPPKPELRPERRQRPRQVDVSTEPQPQVTIKLLTDDPNVIIYWLGDEKGD